MRIDAHQHFWYYVADDYDWIADNMAVLQRDYLPEDLGKELQSHGMDGSVVVQARQSLFETRWLLMLAQRYDFIKGVVGWIDLCADDLTAQLTAIPGNPKLKGFRHVLHDEPDAGFMLRPAFVRGVRTLAEHGYSYDILIFSRQLPEACQLVEQLPAMRLVIDHIAKPDIKQQEWEPWQQGIAELAAHPHVYCKLSGMLTEADWHHWRASDVERYLEHVFSCFGPERVMFGSDWPVCRLAGDYGQVEGLVADFVRRRYPDHEKAVFGDNARHFYALDDNQQ